MDYLQWKTQLSKKQFDTTVPYVDKVKSVKKHGGFPTEVSDMARNMKMELLTVELKKHENRDDLDFLQMNCYVPCSIYSI